MLRGRGRRFSTHLVVYILVVSFMTMALAPAAYAEPLSSENDINSFILPGQTRDFQWSVYRTAMGWDFIGIMEDATKPINAFKIIEVAKLVARSSYAGWQSDSTRGRRPAAFGGQV